VTYTKEQRLAVLELVHTVGELIREVSPVPSGELFARLQPSMNLATYQALLESLERVQLIRVRNHLITWIGPKRQAD